VIREHFFPLQKTLVAGDKVISVANHYLKNHVVTNGEFGMIKQVLSEPEIKTVVLRKKGELGLTETIRVELCFREVELGFRNEYGEVNFFKSKIVENLLYNDEPTLSSDENKALYVDFRNRHPDLLTKNKRDEFKEALLNDPYFNAFKLKFGYAITCHKAQGSEWKQVFLKCNSYHKTLTKEYFRWLYTAITRTSAQLFVIDEPHIKLGSEPVFIGNIDLRVDTAPVITENVETEQELLENNFGIQESAPHLLDLLKKVSMALRGSGAEIVDVFHYQWQEVYQLKQDEDLGKVQFIYNGKNRISSVQAQGCGDLELKLTELLNPIVGTTLYTVASDCGDEEFIFESEHLEQFHHRLLEVFPSNNINIVELNSRPWVQRYTFKRDTESAVVEFYYNGKDQFKKVMPMADLSNSKLLLAEIIRLWSAA
ncbi:MAG: hypothetical protein ACI88H_001429, partial [Cocleimonas sp.]